MVLALAAMGGAVWTLDREGQLALRYRSISGNRPARTRRGVQAQHRRLSTASPTTRKACWSTALQTGNDRTIAATRPTSCCVGPVAADLETVGVVGSTASGSRAKGYLRFLAKVQLASDFLGHQLRHFSIGRSCGRSSKFARVVHDSLNVRETAFTIANEGRRLDRVDRLTVAICKGKRCVVEAVSGQDVFDKRSNTVRLLGKLAAAVVASGDPMWYTGDTHDMRRRWKTPCRRTSTRRIEDRGGVAAAASAPPEEDDPNERIAAEAPVGR